MALSQGSDALAADWVRFRELATEGKPDQALQLAEEVIAEAPDASQVAQALMARLFLLYNAGNRDDLLPLLMQIEEQLFAAPAARLNAQYHILAATVAHDHHSYGVALLHIVNAERALEQMDEQSRAAVETWHDLAAIHSRLGYHDRASQASKRAQSLSADIGQPPARDAALLASVQAAVYLDQRGDTDGCLRELTGLVERSRPHVGALTLIDRVVLRYAVRRLAALQHPVALDVPAERGVGPFLKGFNVLGDVCDALATRRPDDALAVLDAATDPLDPLGFAEPLRLRSLALAQLGDHAGALAVERTVLMASSQEELELRRLLADSVSARIDQDRLRKTAEQHARAALSDPLTGLPNRRKVDDFASSLTEAGKAAAIGILDLDEFKAINDNHGHPTGDIVLQRIAGILAREVRPTDLPARYGGDEFVVVLPDTTRSDAVTLGERIEAAIGKEDWSTVVPNTPVAVSIGWAELDADLNAALRSADAALYQRKRDRQSRAGTE